MKLSITLSTRSSWVIKFILPLVLVLGIIFSIDSNAQTVGDYRSFGAGTAWATAANWELCVVNGVWPGVASATFPGQNAPVAGSTVTVRNTHTRIISTALAQSIVNLVVGEGVSGVITLGLAANASATLTCTGTVAISAGGTLQSFVDNDGTHTLNFQSTLVNNGTISFPVGSEQVTMTVGVTAAGATTNNGTLTFGTNFGVKTFIGPVTNTGTWSSTLLTTTGNLVFRNGVSSSTGTFAAGGATFNDVTTNTQSIGGSGAMSFGNVVTLTDGSIVGALVVTNTNTNTVTIGAANTAAQLTGTGGAIFRQGAGSTLSYSGSTITTITLDGATNTPNSVIYTATTATIFPASYNNLTYSGATTGTVLTATTVNVSGDLTANSGTFTAAGTGTVVFNGTATQTISGAGAFSFVNLTLAAIGANNVNVNKSISVSGTLNFTAANARLLVVNSSSNITLGATATVTNFDSDSYIQLDGGTGSNSNLIKTHDGTDNRWEITYPIGTSSGGYTPVLGLTTGVNPAAGSLSVKVINTVSVTGRLKRDFRLSPTGNTATTFTTAAGAGNGFYYQDSDVFPGDLETIYTSVTRATSVTPALAGAYSTSWGTGTINTTTNIFTVTTATPLVSGTSYFFTIGAPQLTTVWYSYQSGLLETIATNPNSWQVWTLDPSGTTLDNPLQIIPDDLDEITILNGFTVTYDPLLPAVALSATTISTGAVLDMSSSTLQTLGTTSGAGLLRVKGINLPTGIYIDFVDATIGGTIEYYDIGGNLPTAQTTYNNLKMTNTAGAITFVLVSNLTVNGDFNITTTGGTATWQINDASAAQRTITLSGDLTVGAGGLIRAGTGNSGSTSPHNLTLYGDLLNSGSIKFFDATDASYSNASYTSGAIYTDVRQGNAVTVTFAGTTDNIVTCNNLTDFYRFVLNKGTGQQAMLTVNSSSIANFRLFAPTNLGSNSGVAPNEYSDNSLSIINGTLQLTGSITIVNLDVATGNNYFSIPQNGVLWLNGATVTVNVTDNNAAYAGTLHKRLMLSGTIKVTLGTLDAGISAGIGTEDGGSYVQEGGTVRCWQLRARAAGTGIFSFNMSGGTLNVGFGYGLNGGYDNDNYSRFDLSAANSSFQMSGGTINIAKPSDPNGGLGGGLYIGSSPGNYSVTGGTINAYIDDVRTGENYAFNITSSAPLYNLNIYRSSGASTAQLIAGVAAAGPPATIAITGLTILNNFTLDGTGALDPTFVCNAQNLTVGGNFDIQAGTSFTPGANIITFNGAGAQTWTHNGTITSLASVVVTKTAATTITLAGGNVFPNISAALTLNSGILADGGKTLTLVTPAVLSNSATHSGAGLIDYQSTAATILGSGGTFGNLTVTTNATIATFGNQTVTGNLRLVGASTTLNISDNALTVLGGLYDAAAGTSTALFSATKRILTIGLHNGGGLTRQGAAGDLIFPVGSSAVGANPTIPYTPMTVNVTAPSHVGTTVTVRPVNSTHPIVTAANQSLRYYWRVTSTGYTGGNAPTLVTHKTYNYSTAVEDNASVNYRAARYDGATFSWAFNNTVFDATAVNVIPNFNTGAGWSAAIGSLLGGEYTCGNSAAFGAVVAYFSRATGPWNVGTTWSTDNVLKHAGAAAGSFPSSNSPVVIGDGGTFPYNHVVTIDANARTCGNLALNTGSTLDCSTFTGLNFGTSTGGTVTGKGTMRIAAYTANIGVFPAGDFTNFIGSSGGTVEWYGGGAVTNTLPIAGPAPQNLILDTYYNLALNPTAGGTLVLPPIASNLLTVYNDMTQGSVAGFTGTVLTNGSVAAKTLVVTNNLSITRGTFSFSSVAGSTTALTVGGNSTVGSTATWSAGTTNTNTLTTPGGITNNGTINFSNTGLVNITFTGTSNVSFTGPATTTTLSLVNVNKGTSQTPTVTFDVAGTVNTNTSGWLTLTNGTFNCNIAGTHTIVSANTTYTIPTTAKLIVGPGNGTLNILSNASNTADLFLNGALEVQGGIVNIAGGASGNDIEYAASGIPTIIVSGGTLNVNGSIRRSTTTIAGALVYQQTGGTVTLGGNASDNTRGVFEIDANTGSSFTLTGASTTLNVQRKSTGTGTGYADVFINPVTSNVSSNSTINVGLNGAAQTIRINIAPSIGNFTVVGGTSAQSVTMYSNPMVLLGNLTIQSPSSLNTNPLASPLGLDVSIAGNMSILGTGSYLGGANTTTFNGSTNQSATLTAAPTAFNNLTISNTGGAGANTVTLSGTSPTLNDLNILTGILDVGGFALNVNGDVTNNSIQIGSGSIVMAGAASDHNIFSNGGVFTNLTLLGTANKEVTVQGNTTINGVLNFAAANRYLNIGSNLLTMGTAATISGASSTAFIRTNGVESDLGVAKIWGVGTNLPFTYEVGTLSAYTPVDYTLDVTASGTLTVIPVNSAHLTALNTDGSGEQILDYYWIVSRESTLLGTETPATTFTFDYPSSLMLGAGGTLSAGYLDLTAATLGWITTGHGGSASTTQMSYNDTPATNFPAAGNTYHYSVGTAVTLPNPIVPYYSRLADASVAAPATGGDWSSVNSWTLQSDGLGVPVASAPVGVPVVILPGARINSLTSGRKAFTTTINGILAVSPTASVGHNNGIIRGTGTMRVVSNTFPAGNYAAFVASGGGTIEYVAPMSMNNRSVYNNLSIFSGSVGTVTMTNTNLTLNGNLTIPVGTTLNNASNKNITLAGNWSNTGTFTQGTGTVTFNGALAQTMAGTTTFNNLTINKTANNVTFSGAGLTTVGNVLALTTGHIVAATAHPLSLTSTATISGGSASSFIAGPVCKVLPGTSFTFPLGSVAVNRYRPASINNASAPDTWCNEYFGQDPTLGSFSSLAMNIANIGTVSQFEYYVISRSGGTSADVTLTYGPGSYNPINGNVFGSTSVGSLRVARWNGTQWDLPPGAPAASHSNSTSNAGVSGTITATGITAFSPITPASSETPSPLPIELISFAGRLTPIGVELSWKTLTETNNDYFHIEKSAGGEKFGSIGKIPGAGNSVTPKQYQFLDGKPFLGKSYYRLKQVDFDGKFTYSNIISIDYDGTDQVMVSIYPNPAKGREVTIDISGLKEISSLALSIHDQLGREHIKANVEVDQLTGTVTKTWDVQNMANGIYILKVGSNISRRIIISK